MKSEVSYKSEVEIVVTGVLLQRRRALQQQVVGSVLEKRI